MREYLDPLHAAGAKPLHVERIVRAWLLGGSLAAGSSPKHSQLPAKVRALLPELEAALEGVAEVVSEHPSGDGSCRLLVRLADGYTVESVLLPRGAQCVSTQVGCAVGCTFCMTGREGLLRQLSSAEILAQLALGRRRRRVGRVVLMGMGEPTHNLPAVLEAIDLMGGPGDLGHKQIVFSTVGDPRAFERLRASRVKPALALSLHSTDPERRAQLLPRAPRVDPFELVQLADAYAQSTGHPLQIQWTLLAGINDGDDELERLIAWLRGRRVVVNFIPYNPLPDLAYERSSLDRARALIHALESQRILAKLRQTIGTDVDGACGQLRARVLESGPVFEPGQVF